MGLLQSSAAHWWTDMERRQGPDDELSLYSESRGVEVKWGRGAGISDAEYGDGLEIHGREGPRL